MAGGDPVGLPEGAEVRIDLRGVRVVAFAERREIAAVLPLEDPLDAHVPDSGQRGPRQPVAGGETVLHPLDHRLERPARSPE